MEEVQDRHELRTGGMKAKEPACPQEPPPPPSLPSPPSPAASESPASEAHARQLLLEEWGTPSRRSLELPPGLTWKLLFLRRPLYRNLLRSSNPEGADRARPPSGGSWSGRLPPALGQASCPSRGALRGWGGGRMWRGTASAGLRLYHLPISGINIYTSAPPTGPTQQPLEALVECLVAGFQGREWSWRPGTSDLLFLHLAGNFHGWFIRTEKLQHNCSWMVKHQCVDLLAEDLCWEELLDDEQPDITVMDWYEDSRLDVCVYELHVWLLAADRCTVIAQHHVAPRTSARGPPGRWIQVSHVFRQYGPGVRFVHFLHKTKNRTEPGGLRRKRVTNSSVSVQFRE
ncbi:LOW QUALITY PROTEIN: F-box only protein 50-like [Rhynchonycteris naso]